MYNWNANIRGAGFPVQSQQLFPIGGAPMAQVPFQAQAVHWAQQQQLGLMMGQGWAPAGQQGIYPQHGLYPGIMPLPVTQIMPGVGPAPPSQPPPPLPAEPPPPSPKAQPPPPPPPSTPSKEDSNPPQKPEKTTSKWDQRSREQSRSAENAPTTNQPPLPGSQPKPPLNSSTSQPGPPQGASTGQPRLPYGAQTAPGQVNSHGPAPGHTHGPTTSQLASLPNQEKPLISEKQKPDPGLLAELEKVKTEEAAFLEQYKQWKKQYDDWREQNQNHPNKEQFRQYLDQWKTYELQMETRRTTIQVEKHFLEEKLSLQAAATRPSSGSSSQGFNVSGQPDQRVGISGPAHRFDSGGGDEKGEEDMNLDEDEAGGGIIESGHSVAGEAWQERPDTSSRNQSGDGGRHRQQFSTNQWEDRSLRDTGWDRRRDFNESGGLSERGDWSGGHPDQRQTFGREAQDRGLDFIGSGGGGGVPSGGRGALLGDKGSGNVGLGGGGREAILRDSDSGYVGPGGGRGTLLEDSGSGYVGPGGVRGALLVDSSSGYVGSGGGRGTLLGDSGSGYVGPGGGGRGTLLGDSGSGYVGPGGGGRGALHGNSGRGALHGNSGSGYVGPGGGSRGALHGNSSSGYVGPSGGRSALIEDSGLGYMRPGGGRETIFRDEGPGYVGPGGVCGPPEETVEPLLMNPGVDSDLRETGYRNLRDDFAGNHPEGLYSSSDGFDNKFGVGGGRDSEFIRGRGGAFSRGRGLGPSRGRGADILPDRSDFSRGRGGTLGRGEWSDILPDRSDFLSDFSGGRGGMFGRGGDLLMERSRGDLHRGRGHIPLERGERGGDFQEKDGDMNNFEDFPRGRGRFAPRGRGLPSLLSFEFSETIRQRFADFDSGNFENGPDLAERTDFKIRGRGLDEARSRGLEEGRDRESDVVRDRGLDEGKSRGLDEERGRGLEEGRVNELEAGRDRGMEEGRGRNAQDFNGDDVDFDGRFYPGDGGRGGRGGYPGRVGRFIDRDTEFSLSQRGRGAIQGRGGMAERGGMAGTGVMIEKGSMAGTGVMIERGGMAQRVGLDSLSEDHHPQLGRTLPGGENKLLGQFDDSKDFGVRGIVRGQGEDLNTRWDDQRDKMLERSEIGHPKVTGPTDNGESLERGPGKKMADEDEPDIKKRRISLEVAREELVARPPFNPGDPYRLSTRDRPPFRDPYLRDPYFDPYMLPEFDRLSARASVLEPAQERKPASQERKPASQERKPASQERKPVQCIDYGHGGINVEKKAKTTEIIEYGHGQALEVKSADRDMDRLFPGRPGTDIQRGRVREEEEAVRGSYRGYPGEGSERELRERPLVWDRDRFVEDDDPQRGLGMSRLSARDDGRKGGGRGRDDLYGGREDGRSVRGRYDYPDPGDDYYIRQENSRLGDPYLDRGRENIPERDKASVRDSRDPYGRAVSPPAVRQATPPLPKAEVVKVEDLLCSPNRHSRPPQIVIIIRGLPGSGKTYTSKLLREKEISSGGAAPRMLCLDDYFMVEVEREVIDPETGKKVKKRVMDYEYEQALEETYRQSLLKSFKKTVDDGFFPFIIVDGTNEKVAHFSEFWSYAKSKGFQVYVGEMTADVPTCIQRNIHHWTEWDIEKVKNSWEPLPSHYIRLDLRWLLQEDSIPEVEMEDTQAEEGEEDKEEDDESDTKKAYTKSKWELDTSEETLDKLDGIRVSKKHIAEHQSLNEYLQLDLMDEDYFSRESVPGKKRVRWADLEERKTQNRRRNLGFIVGQTQQDWARITDDDFANKALNQTKYYYKN